MSSMEQSDKKLVQMTFVRVEETSILGARAIYIVLSGAKEGSEEREYKVLVPVELSKEYELAIRHFFAERTPEKGILDDFQKASGIHIRKIVVNDGRDPSSSEALVYTLSEMGEAVTFPAPTHSAVLYAILSSLPILVDWSLTEEEPLRDPKDDPLYYDADKMEETWNTCITAIEGGAKPEEVFTSQEEKERLGELSDILLEHLMKRAVEVENYEWAHLIQTHLKAKHGEEE